MVKRQSSQRKGALQYLRKVKIAFLFIAVSNGAYILSDEQRNVGASSPSSFSLDFIIAVKSFELYSSSVTSSCEGLIVIPLSLSLGTAYVLALERTAAILHLTVPFPLLLLAIPVVSAVSAFNSNADSISALLRIMITDPSLRPREDTSAFISVEEEEEREEEGEEERVEAAMGRKDSFTHAVKLGAVTHFAISNTPRAHMGNFARSASLKASFEELLETITSTDFVKVFLV